MHRAGRTQEQQGWCSCPWLLVAAKPTALVSTVAAMKTKLQLQPAPWPGRGLRNREEKKSSSGHGISPWGPGSRPWLQRCCLTGELSSSSGGSTEVSDLLATEKSTTREPGSTPAIPQPLPSLHHKVLPIPK